jgi:hypothetical protein
MLPEIPKYEQRWVAFFDILGFKSFIEGTTDPSKLYLLIDRYHETLKELQEECSYYAEHELTYLWFSDSFIFYSMDGSGGSYTVIQEACKHFLESNIYHRVPMRGAIAFGNLYTDENSKLVIGNSLVEAYTYCEDQNWINFILTPSAARRAIELGFTPQHHSFVDEGIILKTLPTENVYAYTYCSGQANYDSPLLPYLNEMQHFAPEIARTKYQNTVDYINKYWQRIR